MKYDEKKFYMQVAKIIESVDSFDFDLYGKQQIHLKEYLYKVKFDLQDTLEANGFNYTYATRDGKGSNKIRLIKK